MSSDFTFNKHDEIRGKHALFSPSQSAWVRYDEGKIADRVRNQYRTPLGTEIHDFAASQIELGHRYTSVREIKKEIETYIYAKYTFLSEDLKISEYGKKLLIYLKFVPKEVLEVTMCYINDGIRYGMNVEQGLKYSEFVYGHADTICFKNNILRIHDLKTGDGPAHIEQLKLYAALFCLEYVIKPSTIKIELSLYHWDEITQLEPDLEEIINLMDSIIKATNISQEVEKEN